KKHRFRLNGKVCPVKRIAYVIVYRRKPPLKFTKCNINKQCINPAHFESKTSDCDDNKKPKRHKRLNKEQIFKILNNEEIDEDIIISKSTISRIRNRQSYLSVI